MEKELTFLELRAKEVINITDGRRLGHIVDLVADKCGKIIGLVAPGTRRFFFRACDDIFIPFCDIEKIGSDVILVCLGKGKKDHDKGHNKNELRFECRAGNKYCDHDKKHGDHCNCDNCCNLRAEWVYSRGKSKAHSHAEKNNYESPDESDYENSYKSYYNKYDDRNH